MQRIAHISDSHGAFLPIRAKGIDAIIHSGDLPPDPPPTHGHKLEIVQRWQRQWVQEHIEDFKAQVDGRPFLFTRGNHCHYGHEWLEEELKKESINAICLHDKVVSFNGSTCMDCLISR